jgi:hypothetical protein
VSGSDVAVSDDPACRAVTRRPALVGLAALSVFLGFVAVTRAAHVVLAADAHRNLAAASALINGAFGSVADYLYSPLAAALAVPALALDPSIAVAAWFALEVALLVVGTALVTRGLCDIDRVLIGVVVIGFLPVVYDLELGNVTVVVIAALAAIAWMPDRVATGIPLGIILATAPKPQLIPVLIWLAIVHRRALLGVLVTAVLATLVGIALTGPTAYEAWIAALRAPAYLNSGEVINLALWSLPAVIAIPAAAVAILGFVVTLRRGYWPGLVGAICVGLLLAPYTLIYGAGLLLVAAPAAVRASPSVVFVLAIIAPALLVVAFPVWVGLVFAAAAVLPAAAWPSPGAALARFDSPMGQQALP